MNVEELKELISLDEFVRLSDKWQEKRYELTKGIQYNITNLQIAKVYADCELELLETVKKVMDHQKEVLGIG